MNILHTEWWSVGIPTEWWAEQEEELVVIYFTQVIPATGLDDHAKLRTMIYSSILE